MGYIFWCAVIAFMLIFAMLVAGIYMGNHSRSSRRYNKLVKEKDCRVCMKKDKLSCPADNECYHHPHKPYFKER